MKCKISVLVPVALVALAALPAAADDARVVMPPMDGKAATETYQGKGRINAVDAKSGKITLSHGPIPGFDLPAKAMDFTVQDKVLLTKLKPGQKVAFKLIEVRKGQYEISEITVVK